MIMKKDTKTQSRFDRVTDQIKKITTFDFELIAFEEGFLFKISTSDSNERFYTIQVFLPPRIWVPAKNFKPFSRRDYLKFLIEDSIGQLFVKRYSAQ